MFAMKTKTALTDFSLFYSFHFIYVNSEENIDVDADQENKLQFRSNEKAAQHLQQYKIIIVGING